jgi:Zn ribbon nucleic-acid-binding protein
MRWRRSFMDEALETLEQLGMQACPVCGSADSLGMSPFPVLLVDAGFSRDDDSPPGKERSEGDLTFALRIECATCGHLMLFNSLRFRSEDQKIMVRELTDEHGQPGE